MATYNFILGQNASSVSSTWPYTSALMAPCNAISDASYFSCDTQSRSRSPEDHTYALTQFYNGNTKYLAITASCYDAGGNEIVMPSGSSGFLLCYNATPAGGNLTCRLKLGNATLEFRTQSGYVEDFVRCRYNTLKTARLNTLLPQSVADYLENFGMYYGTYSAYENSSVNNNITCANYNGDSFSSNLSFQRLSSNSPYLELDVAQAAAQADYKKIVVIPVFVAKHRTISFATTNADCPVSLESIPIYSDDFGYSGITNQNRGYSANVELPTPTEPEGWKFLGWSDSTSSGAATYTSISSYPAADKTIYAHWERRTRLDVTFDAQGGYVSPQTKEVYNGLPYGTLPVPRRTGYQFDGWFTAASGGTQVTAASIVDVSQLSQQ